MLFSASSCEVSRKRNIEQFSQSHNFQQKISEILTNKRLKLKKTFVSAFTILEDFSLLRGESMEIIKIHEIVRKCFAFVSCERNRLQLKIPLQGLRLPCFDSSARLQRFVIALKGEHERKSTRFEENFQKRKLWHFIAQLSFDVLSVEWHFAT